MNSGQRSNWLATRLFVAGALIAVVAAVREYRPSDADLPWRTLKEGLEEAVQTGKPVYVDLWATWCGPCREMERTTFTDDTVRELLTKSYVPVRIDIDTGEMSDSLRALWNLKGIPTSVILSARGSTLSKRMGYVNATEFIAWLSDPALLAFAGWLEYGSARERAKERLKPLLVIMTRGADHLDEIRDLFLRPAVRSFLQEHFIVTRLTGEGEEEQDQLRDLRAERPLPVTPEGGVLMVIVGTDGITWGTLSLNTMQLDEEQNVINQLGRYLRAGEKKRTPGRS